MSENNIITYPDSLGRKIRRLQGEAVSFYEDTMAKEPETEIDEPTDLPAYRYTSTEVLHGDGLPSHVRIKHVGEAALADVIDIRRAR